MVKYVCIKTVQSPKHLFTNSVCIDNYLTFNVLELTDEGKETSILSSWHAVHAIQ